MQYVESTRSFFSKVFQQLHGEGTAVLDSFFDTTDAVSEPTPAVAVAARTAPRRRFDEGISQRRYEDGVHRRDATKGLELRASQKYHNSRSTFFAHERDGRRSGLVVVAGETTVPLVVVDVVVVVQHMLLLLYSIWCGGGARA